MTELARRAVTCRHWRWMPGMKGVDVAGRQWRRNIASWTGEGHGIRSQYGQVLPDLDDPATLGCLLALVREAWGVGSLVYRPWSGAIRAWRVVTFAHDEDWMTVARVLGEGATEAEALVAALEAAP